MRQTLFMRFISTWLDKQICLVKGHDVVVGFELRYKGVGYQYDRIVVGYYFKCCRCGKRLSIWQRAPISYPDFVLQTKKQQLDLEQRLLKWSNLEK